MVSCRASNTSMSCLTGWGSGIAPAPANGRGRGRRGQRTPALPPRPRCTSRPPTGSGTASSAARTAGEARRRSQANSSGSSTSSTAPQPNSCHNSSDRPSVCAAATTASPYAALQARAGEDPSKTSIENHSATDTDGRRQRPTLSTRRNRRDRRRQPSGRRAANVVDAGDVSPVGVEGRSPTGRMPTTPA